ncbi:ArnT family glycosyltransferase [Paraburkholderia bannensis]|uniref:ArnT family glycosyltransferase n=1 Tax=Paraburkholderia bannensis TaxID=765414 RepID=UPI002AB7DA66|nr:glycosyltransferase family 39 protein [Paraburkholderia bannensis]
MDTTFNVRSSASLLSSSVAFLAPVALWCMALAVSNPLGNFPLNDDWSYALAVRHLLDTAEFRPLGWTATTLLGHTLWGAAFCLVFGYSFEVLRAATMVAALAGLLGFALMLRRLGCERRVAIVATAALGFNPLYFSLAQTYMTDVSFTSVAAIATFFFCRYLQTRRASDMALGLLFALVALSTRQLGLYLPLAMLVTLLLERRRDRRGIVCSAGGVVVGAALFVGLEHWLAVHNATPASYHLPYEWLGKTLSSVELFVDRVQRNLRGALLYLGWFVAPVLVLRVPAIVRLYHRRVWTRAILWGALMIGVAGCVVMIAFHHLMPVASNIIHASGVGPIVLSGWLGHAKLPALPLAFWVFMTIVAMMGGVFLLLYIAALMPSLVSGLRRREAAHTASIRAFLLLGCAAYLCPFIVSGYFDRYLLPPAFMMLALIAMPGGLGQEARVSGARRQTLRAPHVIALMLLFAMGAYAVAGTHDYMSWNRARWILLDRLKVQGVAPTRIDGGLEYNGLYLYDPNYEAKAGSSFWWVHDDQFIVDFVPHDGYQVTDSEDAGGWLPTFKTKLFVLQRKS